MIHLLERREHDKRVVSDSVWRARSDLDKSEAWRRGGRT